MNYKHYYFCLYLLPVNLNPELFSQAKFQEEDERESYKKGQFIDDFLRFCQRMLSDLSSRIKRAKERLALTQEKEERFREQMAQQAAEGSGNKVKIQLCLTNILLAY